MIVCSLLAVNVCFFISVHSISLLVCSPQDAKFNPASFLLVQFLPFLPIFHQFDFDDSLHDQSRLRTPHTNLLLAVFSTHFFECQERRNERKKNSLFPPNSKIDQIINRLLIVANRPNRVRLQIACHISLIAIISSSLLSLHRLCAHIFH